VHTQTLNAPANHRELLAWQEAIKLVVAIYRETAAFPRPYNSGRA